MSEQRDEYASRMPLEIRLAVDGLSGHNDTGYAVVMLLSEESQLRFEELREKLDVHRQTLTNTLDDLQHGGVVKKRAGERIGDQSTGAYELSDFGDRLLDGLHSASQPTDESETDTTEILDHTETNTTSRFEAVSGQSDSNADVTDGNEDSNSGETTDATQDESDRLVGSSAPEEVETIGVPDTLIEEVCDSIDSLPTGTVLRAKPTAGLSPKYKNSLLKNTTKKLSEKDAKVISTALYRLTFTVQGDNPGWSRERCMKFSAKVLIAAGQIYDDVGLREAMSDAVSGNRTRHHRLIKNLKRDMSEINKDTRDQLDQILSDYELLTGTN